jgi:type II secretory pathway pseudopilin PulG
MKEIYGINITRRNFGQSLFEVIMAIAVSAIILTSIVALTSKSVSTSAYSKNKAQANRYAGEAMEYTRTQKEFLEWAAFESKVTYGGGKWCLDTLEYGTGKSVSAESDCLAYIPSTIFIRYIEVTTNAEGSLNIEVKVRWTDEKGTHETFTISTIGRW